MSNWCPIKLALSVSCLLFVLGAPAGAQEPPDPATTGKTLVAEGTYCPKDHRAPGRSQHSHQGEHQKPAWQGLQDVDLSETFIFHPEWGESARLRYRLAEPARVQIRVKKAGTRELFLATILNSELRGAGEHTEIWDGRDYSGNLIDMSEATITLVARKADHEHGTMPLEARSPEEIVHAEEEHIHGTHHPWAEEVPFLHILEPEPGAEVSGLVFVRSAVDEERRGYGDQYGYGMRYYVDGVLVREEFYKPESNGRFAYRLDTTAFADGEHLLQVGMCDHHQHATSASVPVIFRNGR